MTDRFPAVLTTLEETQHRLPELCGSIMFHQLPSDVLPVIWEVCPVINALIGTQAVLGPNRQFTLTSLGNAMGTDGVKVNVGGGVLVGNGVCVGKSVGSDRVTVAEGSASSVGVSVPGAFDGKLQASMAKTSTSAGNKIRGFIISPLLKSILHGHDTTDNRPFGLSP